MNREKAIAYSLLAHVRNTSSLINGPLDIFVPLVKRAIYKMNGAKIFSGKSISEINEYAKKLYDIDFPIPVLRSILEIIINDVNQGAFFLHNDNSFSIANYTFTEFEETVRKRKDEVKILEELFQEFCGKSEHKVRDSTSIFKFLEKNKISLAKHLSNVEITNGEDSLVEAKFINYFKKVPSVYELLKNLYLGSMLSEYIEYTPVDIQMDVELLFDTNFVISLIDLNTPESNNTCNTLIKIAKEQGYKLTILKETIEEIKCLLIRKAKTLNTSFLVKEVYAEDICNACERRELKQIDLERMIDNIESIILSYGIVTAIDTSETIKEALGSREYRYYKEKRSSEISARHDAIALYYVKNKRSKRRIKDFVDVNCWFVNNAISRDHTKSTYEKIYQPEIIKADDLLSILWLSNPQVNGFINADDMADIGLSSLVSLTFSESLPKTAIIREFEDNIKKYGNDEVTSKDIIRVATRIADKQLTDIEELNNLATKNQELFVQRLEEESQKQAEIDAEKDKALETIVERFVHELESIRQAKEKIEEKAQSISGIEQESTQRQVEIESLTSEIKEKDRKLKQNNIDSKVKQWQLTSRLIVLVTTTVFAICVLYVFLYVDSILEEKFIGFIAAVASIIWVFTLNLLYGRHFDYGNIEAYTKKL